MNVKRLLFVPLLLFVAFSMIVLPVAAGNGNNGLYPLELESYGYGSIKTGWFSSMRGIAEFEYDWDDDEAEIDIMDEFEVYWDIDKGTMTKLWGDVYRFQASDPEHPDGPIHYDDPSDYIRVLVFAKEDTEMGFVLVFGRGTRFIGAAEIDDWDTLD